MVQTSPYHRGRAWTLMFVFLFVNLFSLFFCLSTLLNGWVHAHGILVKSFEFRNGFDILDRGSFVVVHPHSTLFVCHLVMQPQNIEIENTVKFAVFRHTRATVYTDQPKIWCERVHSCMPNLAMMSEEVCMGASKIQNLVKFAVSFPQGWCDALIQVKFSIEEHTTDSRSCAKIPPDQGRGNEYGLLNTLAAKLLNRSIQQWEKWNNNNTHTSKQCTWDTTTSDR